MWSTRFTTAPPTSTSASSNGTRRPPYLDTAANQSHRPPFNSRSSSLNVLAKGNTSTSSLSSARFASGSGLKQEITAAPNAKDPPLVLHEIVRGSTGHEVHSWQSRLAERPDGLVVNVDFGSVTLEHFYSDLSREKSEPQEGEGSLAHTDRECECSCDSVLRSIELSLASFQKDLGNVSTDIETLQSRSTTLTEQLANRQNVEKLLGPAVEEASIPPSTIKKLSEGDIDKDWIAALAILDNRLNNIDHLLRDSSEDLVASDLKPLLDNLTNIVSKFDLNALDRIRNFFVSQIRALRSTNINAQVIQQRAFLSYKELFAFLHSHHHQLADEITQAYGYTMRWYYLSNFTRYMQAMQKIPTYAIDKSDALGAEQSLPRGPVTGSTNPPKAPNALSVGRRSNILNRLDDAVLPFHVAAEAKSPAYIESPFHAFTAAISDNASAEYMFLTSFFPSLSFSALSRTFSSIFGPTFDLSYSFTKQLVSESFDCLGLLLCVRITQHFAFSLQRRRCPVAEGWINGTNMLLWPRFQLGMDIQIDSVKRATSSLSSTRPTLSLSLNKVDDGKANTAPHPLVQRFGQLLQGLLTLSNDNREVSSILPSNQARETTATKSDVEPTGRSLQRLRSEVEMFLARACKGFNPAKRSKFLDNNYSLILTIIEDTNGSLATEQREWLEERRTLLGAD
ncbi:uncharacterized protein KY384_008669 [Bacidia gigantensis]|uniref:uncharacterized protein n=1 Tax=Bacidia gigantensis TaxID=2732470 RepID=UPI001D0383EF|nr:uncharacterized protein KY384_008669 [Bacidia gigantensis]KAG8526469.1 hypothetical protein KY384_008669 [Bacidia gigantensis]